MARSPFEFKEAGDVVRIPFEQLESELGVGDLDTEILPTSKGLRVNFPVKPVRRNCKSYYIAYLACGIETRDGVQLLAIILELLSPFCYARLPGPGSASLLKIPYNSVISSEVQVDDRAYFLKETQYTPKSAVDIVLDITSLHVFCKETDFLIIAHFKWTASGNRWTEKPRGQTGCSFNVTTKTDESSYLVVRHKSLQLGLVIAIGLEPNRYAKEEKHIFYIDMCPIGKGAGCIPYHRGGNIFQKVLNSWKRKQDFGLARSIASNASLPNGLSVISMITCDKAVVESDGSGTNPYAGLFYKLSVRAIKTN